MAVRRRKWMRFSDSQLLQMRICDLGVTLRGTPYERLLKQVGRELRRQGILFRPRFWLSTEWFCPDGIPGIAIPFFLAHPRLRKLEQSMMYDVEGATQEWFLKILRHEVGHAIEHAFKLQSHPLRKKVFGPTSKAYPKFYQPRPYSKSYVVHLDASYAQSHPDEDFAETFAVWLTPGLKWQSRFRGWKAMEKLRAMDWLMNEICGVKPRIKAVKEVEPVSRIRMTLGEYYAKKRETYGVVHPSFFDHDLKRLFSAHSRFRRNPSAARFVSKIRPEILKNLSRWTGQYQYTLENLYREMTERCRVLKLRLMTNESATKDQFLTFMTVQTMNFIHRGRHRIPL